MRLALAALASFLVVACGGPQKQPPHQGVGTSPGQEEQAAPHHDDTDDAPSASPRQESDEGDGEQTPPRP